jgi:excisionase family DNA binding protein
MSTASLTEEPERYITSKEVAQVATVTKRTVTAWVQEHRIPFYRIGHRSIRFRLSEIDDFLKSLRVPAAPRSACEKAKQPEEE